jgi:hypothetical protein
MNLELDNSNASSINDRAISALKCKHDFIQLSILALEFEYDQELFMLCEYYYTNKQKLLI